MTKQVVWAFRIFFLQFDTKFAYKQQRLARIGTILWLLMSFKISPSLTYHAAGQKCRVWHARPRATAEDIGHTVPTMYLAVHGCAGYF